MKNRIKNQLIGEIGNRFSDAVVITDSKGLIQWTNHAFHTLCGYTKKEVMGSRPGDFLQGKNTDPETIRRLHDARANGKYVNVEILNYHKNGHSYWVSISITPVKNPAGELTGFISIERDVTEQKRRTAEMEKQIVEVYTALLASEEERLKSETNEDPFLSNLGK